MPHAPRRPCVQSGCAHLQPCPVHKRHQQAGQTYRDRKAHEPWSALYDTARWKRLRRAVLADEPLCRQCAQDGQTTLATVIDHIQPHRGDDTLAYDRANLQPLCARHHGTKTAQEVWR